MLDLVIHSWYKCIMDSDLFIIVDDTPAEIPQDECEGANNTWMAECVRIVAEINVNQ